MELNQSFRLPTILGAEPSTAEDENHRMWPLQFGELPAFRSMIGKLIVGKDRSGHDVSSHMKFSTFSM
jgi:hypothetical protein